MTVTSQHHRLKHSVCEKTKATEGAVEKQISWGEQNCTGPVGDTEIGKWRGTQWRWKQKNRWGGERWEEKTRAGKNKVKAGRRIAEFRVYNGHVACDSMQGLTRSARGTDGPTQQYLCMHVCAFRLHASLSIICLFSCLTCYSMWQTTPLIWLSIR